MKHAPTEPYGYLRVLHAVPKPLSYDFYLDEALYAKDLLFEDFTLYKPLIAGEHHLSCCLHKETEIFLTKPFWISRGKIYTLIVTYAPHTEDIQYYLINDHPKKIPEEHLLLRVGTFYQNPSCHQLQLVDTKPIFKKLSPCQPSPYLSFMPGTYNIELLDLETKKVIAKKEKCDLKPTRYYSFYVIGGNKQFPTHLILTIDGNSFLSFDTPS